ncbi:hypothetical protein HUU39_24745 [candidate division KSB1 bacterium]|nr:hypothetical protein [bacterium]NUM68442.1 hypothetical protein [candidate division KSB1 bacterium]
MPAHERTELCRNARSIIIEKFYREIITEDLRSDSIELVFLGAFVFQVRSTRIMKAAPVEVSNEAIAMLLSPATNSIPHNRKQPPFDATLSLPTFPFCSSVRRMRKEPHRGFFIIPSPLCRVWGASQRMKTQ